MQALLEALIALRVHVEAAIDFPEEEIDFLADPVIGRQLGVLRQQLQTLLTEARRGLRLNDGLRVAIVGRPNVGKSSLLNALAGADRAIVTEIAGTTRDVLREQLVLDGVAVELIDTAGLRDSDDPVEREGVRRARAQLEHADVALLVTDAENLQGDIAALESLPATPQRLVVINKIDRDGGSPGRDAERRELLRLSAQSGVGLDTLRDALRELAGGDQDEATGGAFSARRRHVLALEAVDTHLALTDEVLAAGAGELAAEELRQAQQALAEITGEFHSDDLLGAIFSSFCIGK